MKCDMCGSVDTYVKNHEHVYYIKDREIKFILERRFCQKCDNLVYDKDLDNLVSKEAIKIYNEKYGISGEQIIQLRNHYNLSQQAFAKIIGCAKKTLISYEQNKSVPNDIYLITLKTLMSSPFTLLTMIKSNQERFEEKEYLKIENKLDKAFKSSDKDLDIVYTNPSIYNGYTAFSIEKVKNMILLFADKCVLKTKLLKEMFYADFLAYKETGASITGLEYAKINYGPVPDGFEKILRDLTKDSSIINNIEFKGEFERHNIVKNTEINRQIFTDEEIKIIKKVKNFFKNYNSSDIVTFSHKEKAFTETEFKNLISYDYAFDIDSIK